jgi:ABC-type transport system involved in multi-copper enzyme maturation permease subunit
MYMRLWWKDARQFWPIWGFLVLAAGVTQLLMERFASPEARGGLLVPIAMGWTCLYAFAAGAAAFAGEREAGTLRLLDLLPASRRDVWTGKVSFAIVSTVGLASVLTALAATDGPPHPGWTWSMADDEALLMLGTLISQALAWGLLCSSMSPSALLAAVAAIGLTGISRIVSIAGQYQTRAEPLVWDLGVALAALAGSWIVFTWGRPDRRLLPAARLPFAVRLRSPIEVSWAGRPRPAADRSRKPIAPPEATLDVAPPIAARPPAIAAARWSGDRPRPRSRLAEFRHLVWQTMREGRTTWLFLLAFGLVYPTLLFLDGGPNRIEATPFLFCEACIGLVAGVSAFGLENRRRTHRFLVHHGARPGLVWLAKLSTWCFGLALLWGPLAYLLLGWNAPIPERGQQQAIIAMVLALSLFFAVAVLCGMAIPRGITAGVVALVVSLLLTIGQGGLVAVGMLPIWGLLVLPLAFLAATSAWSGDWLLDRPAPGRWVRLGLVLSGVLTAAFGGYAGWRAWSVPDVGPIPMPSDWVAATAPLPDDLNAAPLYREAAYRLNLGSNRGTSVSMTRLVAPTPDLDKHPEALDLIRRASAQPECQFFNPGRMTLATRIDIPPMHELAEAVLARARRRLHDGDLAAAWDDIMLLFRMARQTRQGATMIQALTSLSIERATLDLAEQWANAPGQSPDRLRAALAAYRARPAMTPPSEIIRAEGLLVERTIDLPIDDLGDLVAKMQGESRAVSTEEMLKLDLVITPWERARARRINRLMTAESARLAALEPRQRTTGPIVPAIDQQSFERERYTLLALLGANSGSYAQAEDRTEVERRALVYVMAVREWLLRHDGRFPDRIEELVPEELPSLPLDPYSGRSFGYMTFAQAAGMYPSIYDRLHPHWPAESRLVYSAGPDGRDDHGQFVMEMGAGSGGDIVFPIFPTTSEKKGR